MDSNLISRAKEQFFSAMCCPNPSIKLLQTAHRLLEWPILVGDDASNVLLQIPDREIGSVWYDSMLAERRVNPELYVHFHDTMHKVYNPSGDDIQIIPGEDERYPIRVYLNIRIYGGTELQVIFHVSKEQVTQEERVVLQLLFQALTAESRKYHRANTQIPSSKWLQRSVRLLVEGKYDEKILDHHGKSVEAAISGDYILVVILLEDSAGKEGLEPFYIEQLGKQLSNSVSIPYEGNIVTLCGRISGDTLPCLDLLVEFLRTYSLVAGVGVRFPGNLRQLKTMYEQALLTVRLGRKVCPKEFLFEYETLIPLQVFIPALQKFPVETFLHPSVLSIIKYDEKNGTEYLKTLRAYVVSGKSNKEAIRLLAVHPNTLLYRLTKIKELFEIDFMDGRLTTTLLTNVLMLVVDRPDLLPMLDVSTPIMESSHHRE